MKTICTQENLKAGLLTVGRVVSSTNTLPILNNFLLKTENGQLKISSTNLELAIITSIRCRVEEEGGATVPAKTLIELINTLPNKNITLETKNNQLHIESENYHTNIKTLPTDEFPLIPTVEGKTHLFLDSQELKGAIEQVIFAASNNQTQPEISGVLFSAEKQSLRLAATDRYRLAEKKLNLKQVAISAQEAILPQKTAAELSRVVGAQSGDVEMMFSETQVSIVFKETQIISRLVDGQYPDYQQIIPTEFQTTVSTETMPLLGALKAAGVFSQSNSSVKIEFSEAKQQLLLTADSAELGNSSVELPAKVSGRGCAVILNYHYLLDCLGGLETKNIVIKLIDDSSPSLVLPEGKDDYIYLVMPIKS